MFKGWLKLHRSLLDNDLWLAEPFTKGQAWVDLIGHANHRPGSVWIRGIEVEVKRGQLAWSELTMAERWKWSRGKVRRYLKTLETRQMIVQQTSRVTTILTICKYEVYQGSDTTDETTDGTTNNTTGGTAGGQQAVHKQECKNGENGKNDEIDTVISYLNDRAGRKFKNVQGNAKHINARLKEGHTVDDMKAVIDKKVAEWKGGPMDEYLRPATLFNSEKFDGYLNAEGPAKANRHSGFNDRDYSAGIKQDAGDGEANF